MDRNGPAERVVDEPAASPIRLGEKAADLGIQVSQQSVDQDVFGEPIHLGGDVDDRAGGPAAEHPLDLRMDRFDECGEDVAMECRLYQPALPNVSLPESRDQPVAEHPASGTAGR